MKITDPLEELHHWLGLLEVDLRLGIDRRHLKSTARLCTLLMDKLEQEPRLNRYAFNCLALRFLDLQRAMGTDAPARPNPEAKSAGKFRVITGGRAQTGSRRR